VTVAVAPLRQTFAASEAVDWVLALAETSGISIKDAVDTFLVENELEYDAQVHLARFGLIEKAGQRYSTARQHFGEADGDGARFHFRNQAKYEAWLEPLLIRYAASDGTQKALLHFTVEDWDNLSASFGTKARAYARVSKLARDVSKLLVSSGSDMTSDLPDSEQREIAERVRETWS